MHGAMFTRGPKQLHHTAVFVGGTNVAAGERLTAVRDAFFGPLRVSVMLEPGGCNTTAAAALVAAGRHLKLDNCSAVVLGATGPVGRRVVRLLARAGANVKVCSRDKARAQSVCDDVAAVLPASKLVPTATTDEQALQAAVANTRLIVAAGAAGVEVLPQRLLEEATAAEVAIDLNAVPPTGIGGIEAQDAAASRGASSRTARSAWAGSR